MLSVLQDILCAILNLPIIIADWLVALCNLFFVAIGATLAFILGLLPDMPDPANPPDSEVMGYAMWLAPIDDLVAGLFTVAVLVIAFMAIRVILNWLKAVSS